MKTLFLFLLSQTIWASNQILVTGGSYKPLLGKGKEAQVKSFYIDEHAVTNEDFLEFVKKNSEWQRGNTPSLFSDDKYLKHWQGPLKIGPNINPNSPVVNISWFAANAYCETKGLRLPNVDEYEYLSQFGPEGSDKDVKSIILDWYSRPNPDKLAAVKTTFKNKFGVWDIHGLVWEWNNDFNTTFVTGESRGDTALEKSLYCGGGSIGAADPSDYASFMRFGFRSSLKGNYSVSNLGFRCAKEKM